MRGGPCAFGRGLRASLGCRWGTGNGKGAGLVGRRSEEGPCFGHNLGGARGNSLFGEPNSNKNPRSLAALSSLSLSLSSPSHRRLSPPPLPHLLCSNTHSRKRFYILSSLFFTVCPVAHPLFPPFFVFFLPAQFSVAVMSAPAETTAAPVEEVKPTETPAPAAEETPAAPAAEEAPKAEEAAAAEPVCSLLNPPREHSLTSFTGSPQGRDC